METIEKMRSELHELLDKYGCGNDRVLKKSQELDKQITLYYKNRGQALYK